MHNLEEIEEQARTWAKDRHPNAAPERYAAFINSVTYALFRFTGRFGGPSIREHVANEALNDIGKKWREEQSGVLYEFLDPWIFGTIRDEHIKWWLIRRDICFDNDPSDSIELSQAIDGLSVKILKDERYESTRIWALTLRKIRIIAAMRSESIVETLERLASEELARLRYHGNDKSQMN